MFNVYLLSVIAIGGAIGASCRYLIAALCGLIFGQNFPFATLIANLIGACLMGILIAALEQSVLTSAMWRPLIGVGFLGALTTFSTFSMESANLIQQGEIAKACLYILLNVISSIGIYFCAYLILSKVWA